MQEKFLEKFFSSRFGRDFYLTGGTALARFYFNHRRSLDLDLFSHNQKADFNEINLEILKIINALGLTLTKQVNTETFLQYICEGKSALDLLKQFNKTQMLKFYDNLSKKLLAKIKPKE